MVWQRRKKITTAIARLKTSLILSSSAKMFYLAIRRLVQTTADFCPFLCPVKKLAHVEDIVRIT